jgi:uncharacterized RDD family membrane protein YckC
MALVAKHITAEPPPLATGCEREIPDGVTRVIERTMAKKPEDRYASYAELIESLHGARQMALAPASFWSRGAATLVDVAIFGLLAWTISGVLLALYPIYYFLSHWLWGQSIGKKLVGLRMATPEGKCPPMRRLLLRELVAIWALGAALGLAVQRSDRSLPVIHAMWRLQGASYQTAIRSGATAAWGPHYRLAIYRLMWKNRAVVAKTYWPSALFAALGLFGFAVALVDRQRRALHDIVAGTLVSHVQPRQRSP